MIRRGDAVGRVWEDQEDREDPTGKEGRLDLAGRVDPEGQAVRDREALKVARHLMEKSIPSPR